MQHCKAGDEAISPIDLGLFVEINQLSIIVCGQLVAMGYYCIVPWSYWGEGGGDLVILTKSLVQLIDDPLRKYCMWQYSVFYIMTYVTGYEKKGPFGIFHKN